MSKISSLVQRTGTSPSSSNQPLSETRVKSDGYRVSKHRNTKNDQVRVKKKKKAENKEEIFNSETKRKRAKEDLRYPAVVDREEINQKLSSETESQNLEPKFGIVRYSSKEKPNVELTYEERASKLDTIFHVNKVKPSTPQSSQLKTGVDVGAIQKTKSNTRMEPDKKRLKKRKKKSSERNNEIIKDKETKQRKLKESKLDRDKIFSREKSREKTAMKEKESTKKALENQKMSVMKDLLQTSAVGQGMTKKIVFHESSKINERGKWFDEKIKEIEVNGKEKDLNNKNIEDNLEKIKNMIEKQSNLGVTEQMNKEKTAVAKQPNVGVTETTNKEKTPVEKQPNLGVTEQINKEKTAVEKQPNLGVTETTNKEKPAVEKQPNLPVTETTNKEKTAVEKPTPVEKKNLDLVRRELFIDSKKMSTTSLLVQIKNKTFEDPQTDKKPWKYSKLKRSRSAELKDIAMRAIRDKKVFCMYDSHVYISKPVKEELLARGWVEMLPDRRYVPRKRGPIITPNAFEHTKEALVKARENLVETVNDALEKAIKEPIKRLMSQPKTRSGEVVDVLSNFCIVPPTNDKRKNNTDIRTFPLICNSEQTDILIEGVHNNGKVEEVPKVEVTAKSPTVKNLEEILDHLKNNRRRINEISNSMNMRNEEWMKKQLEKELMDMKRHEELLKRAHMDALSKNDENVLQLLLEAGEVTNEGKPNTRILVPNDLNENETRIVSGLLSGYGARINFMWASVKPITHMKGFNYVPDLFNKFQKTNYCTKIGLWRYLSTIQWYSSEVKIPIKYPRMYNTGEPDDLKAFYRDFQLTSCMSLLKWLTENFFDHGMKAVQCKTGKVPLKAFDFAIKQCERHMRYKENEDLFSNEDRYPSQDEWNMFLQWFYGITNDHGKIQESDTTRLVTVYSKSVEVLRMMKKHWRDIDSDGKLNIWIMKPYCASCGRGIFMTNNITYIGQHNRYIVQKYIEKPFLIFNTKFDIRQWFLVARLCPLELWMYKESYLRFCSQPFVLRNLHESVHLSNNSVQKKYTNNRQDPDLPDQNMWDSETFKKYLRNIGEDNIWDELIYPGMKDAIITTMLAAQEGFDQEKRSWFEVYGADFMLSHDIKEGPYLIEINENPAMDPSTKVTARLCPQMLRDVIKVVVDYSEDRNASTGNWELIYKQSYSQPNDTAVIIPLQATPIPGKTYHHSYV